MKAEHYGLLVLCFTSNLPTSTATLPLAMDLYNSIMADFLWRILSMSKTSRRSLWKAYIVLPSSTKSTHVALIITWSPQVILLCLLSLYKLSK